MIIGADSRCSNVVTWQPITRSGGTHIVDARDRLAGYVGSHGIVRLLYVLVWSALAVGGLVEGRQDTLYGSCPPEPVEYEADGYESNETDYTSIQMISTIGSSCWMH